MTELEKFKRRMIRMVARLHLQEKKPEDELWEYLRKQTKCDCKWLWERMRALTLKRLKRLLIAEDRQENIAAIARMSLTDWLLFDCILVHENIDVIGTELLAEGRIAEPRPMYDLFSLVQKYDLEGQSGEALARAWTTATVNYNSRGRQCSPMLLQRRWYQLKDLTRQKFYNFWFVYRGNLKLLEEALKDKPTRLQAAVAKRYPHIITTPFLPWEELIQKRLVIMPPEFEYLMKARSGKLPPAIEDNEADLVLLEPEIETIDLGVDSDSDNELREEVEGSKAKQMIADEDAAAVSSITFKQEPMDVDSNFVGSIDLDQTNLDIDMEDIEALENIDIPVADNVANDDSLDNVDAMELTEDETRESEEVESSINEEKELPETSSDYTISATVDVTSSPIRYEDQSFNDSDTVLETFANERLATLRPSSKSIEDTNTMDSENATSPVEEVVPFTDIIQKNVPTNPSEVTYDSEVQTESIAMPQISNVIGNVNMSEESPYELSSNLQNTEKNTAEENIDDEIEDDIIKTDITNGSYEGENVKRNETDEFQANDLSKIKIFEEKTIDHALSEIIPDMTFDDDGIEFIDDGIVEDQDGVHNKNRNDESKCVKEEISSDDGNKNEDSQSIDLKLLMVPIVYTKKLEDMNILKAKPFLHVSDIESIELILNESRPVIQKSVQIKEEQPVTSVIPDGEETANDDLFDQQEIDYSYASDPNEESLDEVPEDEKVNPSSILFQKPRNRDYGPLVVCKNPDFNTRLKRLTVGFLSYTRNRFLLRACKPLTIDLCKAFESKLIDNTIFLKQGTTSEIVVKEEKADAYDNDRVAPPVVSQENLVQTTSVPTSESVPSLMDTMVKQQFLSPPAKELTTHVTKPENEDVVTERNKVIVLPNIDNVRRINRKLLVAEVLPMRVENSNYTKKPPVSLVSPSTEELKPSISEGSSKSTTEKESSGDTVICRGDVIDGVTNNFVNYCKKNKPRPLPWRPTGRERVGFWNITKPKTLTYAADQLLTVDTLNKMLSIIHLKDPIKKIDPNEKVIKNRKKKIRQANELQRKVNEIQRKLTGECSRDLETNPNKPLRKCTKASESMNQTGYGTYCCWVKFKEVHRNTSNPHPCGAQCTCCCRKNNDTETDLSIIKVCESIESVVEQSRDIVKDDGIERVQLEDNVEMNIIDVDGVENKTNNIDDSNTSATNIMPVNYSERSIEENSVTENVEKDTIPDFSNKTVINQDDTSAGNCVVIDSDEPHTQSGKSSHLNEDVVKRKRGRPRKPILLISPPEITIKDNVNVEKKAVTAYSTETVSNQDPTTSTDDCVVIDSDTLETRKIIPPPLKITIHSAENTGEMRRRRGRPLKSCYQQNNSFEGTRPLQQIAPKQPISTNFQVDNSVSVQPTRSRFGLFPIAKNKDKEADKLIMFKKKPKNNPIFLGVNKILLTDVPLPRNNDKPVIEEAPSSSLINTILPRGVNLLLLPNGVLTCTVDPNIQLTAEEITSLGAIIEDIQKRISSVSNTPVQSMPNFQLGPTLELVPGGVPTVLQNDSEIINDGEKNAEEDSNNELQNAESVTPIAENSNLMMESVISTENTVPALDSVDPALDVSTSTIATSSIDQPSSESNITTETEQNISIVNINEEVDPGAPKETSVETQNDKTEKISEQEQRNEPDVSNKKTILSDLMEMSGIFDEDIAPVAETTPQPVATAATATTNVTIDVDNPPPLHIPDSNQSPPKTIVNSLPELTAVTSFKDLKHACLQNGNFFKLDLDTNTLTPINVCIKKKTLPQAPTQFVDLTDDVDDTENAVNVKEKKQQMDEESLPTFTIRKTKTPVITDWQRSVLRSGAAAKPIKLFKVVHPFANSTEQNSKRDEEPNEGIVSDREVKSKTAKRTRKQSFDNQSYKTQYVNFLGSDDEQENYEFEGSFEEPVASVEDSDSSDDEPLAKKVRRRDEILKETRERTVDTATETATSDVNEPKMYESPTGVPENDSESSELPMEEVESEEGPTELEFLSDHNEEDEDCILGF